MPTTAELLSVDEKNLVPTLSAAGKKLSTGGDVVMDFSEVRQIDAPAIKALQEFACLADSKAVKVVLRAVSVDVYKALKLVKLTQRFSFEN